MTKNLDLDGLQSIADNYDLFYIDLWGVIHNGIKPFPYVRRSVNYESLRILSIGRLIPQKGFDISIRAINEVKDIVENYSILGSGVDQAFLENLINEYELKG